MLIHDGILIEAQNEEQIAHAIEIMTQAGRDVCGGLEIGVDVDQRLAGGARFRDKRPMARKMWDAMMDTLLEIRAISRREHAELCYPKQEMRHDKRKVGIGG